MEKLYVVSEVGFEYNDEIYHQPECDALKPVVAYRSRLAAETEAMKRNIAEFRRADLYNYAYEVDDFFHYRHDTERQQGMAILEKYGSPHDGTEEFSEAVKRCSDEDLAQLITLMRVRFFDVTEIEVAG